MRILVALLVLLLSALAGTPARADGDFRVTLLGTGTPSARLDRFGPSTLVEAGDQKLLIDAGRGVPIRLWQLNVPMGRIDALLLTHYHSDHTIGIPDLWLTGWLLSPPPFGRRTRPLRVIGPTGAKELMDNLQRAYALDVKIRIEDEKLPPEGVAVVVDLLIHEVGSARPELMRIPAVQRILSHHTTPREAGIVFAKSRPKLAAYTHLVLLSNEKVPEPTLQDLVARRARPTTVRSRSERT